MEVRKGYKQTDIGIIPNDWNLVSYDEAFSFHSTASYPREQLSEKGDVFYVHYGDIHTKWKNFLDFSKCALPSISQDQAKGFPQLEEGDLIIVDASEDYEGVGTSVEVKNIGERKSISGLHTFLLKNKNDVFINGFKGYIHNNRIVKKQFDKLATGLKVYGVSRGNLKKVFIPTPPTKEEQTAIAQVLSDTDELISSLEKLIEKKKLIKQGTMQQLLTGKKRLPGFSGEWKEVTFNDIIDRFTTGLNPRKNFILNSGGDLFYVTIKNFSNGKLFLDNECDKIDETAFKKINERSDLRKGDIIFASIGRVGDAYLLKETPTNWNINESVFSLRPNQRLIISLLLYYLLTDKSIKDYLETNITGSTFKSIKIGDLKKMPIKIPSTKEEQLDIAQIFSDMDSGIESLEQKLNKYRSIKQGMMQNLLTGKIRLVKPEAAN